MIGAAVVGSVLTFVMLSVSGALDRPDPIVRPAEASFVEVREIVTDSGDSTAAAVGRKVTPSVVSIEIGIDTTQGFRAVGGGSGVIIDTAGLIVTNEHVVQDAESVKVVLHDGRTYDAEVVGTDTDTDLAVLRITGHDLLPVELGTTGDLTIGDIAIAVGNPLGLQGGASLTVGVVSAFERQVTAAGASTLFGMLQTDAPITQGSSGGALVDDHGRLVGITTAIGVSTAGAEGIGFAIPVELMQRVTDELITDGTVRHAFLGVELQNDFTEGADGSTIPSGALVAGLAPQSGTAAEAAGIVAGDVITTFEGQPITSRETLISSLRRLRVGDEVSIDVIRDGALVTLTVVLGENLDTP